MGSIAQSWRDVKNIKNEKQANIMMNHEICALLYTSAWLDEAQMLRNLDPSKYPDHDMFYDDNLK